MTNKRDNEVRPLSEGQQTTRWLLLKQREIVAREAQARLDALREAMAETIAAYTGGDGEGWTVSERDGRLVLVRVDTPTEATDGD